MPYNKHEYMQKQDTQYNNPNIRIIGGKQKLTKDAVKLEITEKPFACGTHCFPDLHRNRSFNFM